jgi:hypothetical protein
VDAPHRGPVLAAISHNLALLADRGLGAVGELRPAREARNLPLVHEQLKVVHVEGKSQRQAHARLPADAIDSIPFQSGADAEEMQLTNTPQWILVKAAEVNGCTPSDSELRGVVPAVGE